MCLQIGLKKKTAAGAAAAAKEAEEHAKEAEKKSSNHVQRKLKARTQHHKLDEVSAGLSSCTGRDSKSLLSCHLISMAPRPMGLFGVRRDLTCSQCAALFPHALG